MQDYITNLQFHSLIVNAKWAEANGPANGTLSQGYAPRDAVGALTQRRIAELVTKRTGIPIKYTKPTVEEYLSQGIISRDGSVNREGFQRLIDLMGDRLFKQKPYPAPEKYLDLSYLRRAQQELGIPSTGK